MIFRFAGGDLGVLATFFSIGRRLDVVRLAEKLQLMGIRRRAILIAAILHRGVSGMDAQVDVKSTGNAAHRVRRRQRRDADPFGGCQKLATIVHAAE